ncbi:MAG: L,D-transpeptidase family protein, partial [Aeromonas veronii]
MSRDGMRAVLLCLLGLWPALSFAFTEKADLVVVKKSTYSRTLMKEGKELKRYWIALGPAPKG